MALNDFLQRVLTDVKRRGIRCDRAVFAEVFTSLAAVARDRIWRFDTVSIPGVGVIWFDEDVLRFRPSINLERGLHDAQLVIQQQKAELDKGSPVPDERHAASYNFFTVDRQAL